MGSKLWAERSGPQSAVAALTFLWRQRDEFRLAGYLSEATVPPIVLGLFDPVL